MRFHVRVGVLGGGAARQARRVGECGAWGRRGGRKPRGGPGGIPFQHRGRHAGGDPGVHGIRPGASSRRPDEGADPGEIDRGRGEPGCWRPWRPPPRICDQLKPRPKGRANWPNSGWPAMHRSGTGSPSPIAANTCGPLWPRSSTSNGCSRPSAPRKRIDAEIRERPQADEALERQSEILTSTPGISHVAAAGLIVQLPELGTLTGSRAVSLAGLAPVTRASGSWKGRSFIRGGRHHMRRLLYYTRVSRDPVHSRSRADVRDPRGQRKPAEGRPYSGDAETPGRHQRARPSRPHLNGARARTPCMSAMHPPGTPGPTAPSASSRLTQRPHPAFAGAVSLPRPITARPEAVRPRPGFDTRRMHDRGNSPHSRDGWACPHGAHAACDSAGPSPASGGPAGALSAVSSGA